MKICDRLGIRISGPAGMGINSLSDVVANVFASLGYNIITDGEYQSIIRGGLNFYDVHICNTRPYLSRKVHILLALDNKNLIANIEDVYDGGIVIISQKTLKKAEKTLQIPKNITLISPEINDVYENIYLLGILVGILSLENSFFETNIRRAFLKKGEEIVQKNLEIFREFVEFGKDFARDLLPKISEKSTSKNLIYGNKAIAYGAIASELAFYSAYPMTPASSILTEIVQSKKVPFLQAEDEIAVINSALGASFTGARSMVGTSGGGFALMSEALSFAAQAEIPIVAVLSQRAGPSTGTPTFHEQGDMFYALNPTFGDVQNIVMIPSTLEEGYFMGGNSLNIAQKYQTTVILLTDKQFSEGKSTVGKLISAPVERGKLCKNPEKDYKRYEITSDGISPYVEVGTENGDFIATSYEHDEYGATSENFSMKQQMTEKRANKLQKLFENEGIYGYEVINPNAKKKIITLSFIRYTAEKFVEDNKEWGLIVITFLSPIDFRLRAEIEKCEEIVFFENNYSGQLQTILTEKLGLHSLFNTIIFHKRKYNLLPFYIEDFEQLLCEQD